MHFLFHLLFFLEITSSLICVVFLILKVFGSLFNLVVRTRKSADAPSIRSRAETSRLRKCGAGFQDIFCVRKVFPSTYMAGRTVPAAYQWSLLRSKIVVFMQQSRNLFVASRQHGRNLRRAYPARIKCRLTVNLPTFRPSRKQSSHIHTPLRQHRQRQHRHGVSAAGTIQQPPGICAANIPPGIR